MATFKYHVTCVDTEIMKLVNVSSKSEIHAAIQNKFKVPAGFRLQMPYDDTWVDVDVEDVEEMPDHGKLQFRLAVAPKNTQDVTVLKREITILLLGESGVGKSTWINALSMYLQFQTLDAAIEGCKRFPICVNLVHVDSVTNKETHITFGEHDSNERRVPCASATQSPKWYQFLAGDIPVNLIDTPGILDTDGTGKDKENMYKTIKFIASFDDLNAICILVKSGANKLTDAFKYGITELLHTLHDSACRNVIFCFTHALVSHFKGDETYNLVKEFLKTDSRLSQIKFGPANVYYFDNQSVRYVAAIKGGVHDDYEQNLTSYSWDQSVKTVQKLINCCMDLEPHKVSETTTLHNARRAVEFLSEPLLLIAEQYVPNMIRLKKAERDITENLSTVRDDGVVLVRVLSVIIEDVKDTNAKVYCMHESCVKAVNSHIVYENPCCTDCVAPSPFKFLCHKFNWAMICKQCGHRIWEHVWRNSNVKVVEGCKEYNMNELKQTMEQLSKEQSQLIETCAVLTVFMHQHTLCGDDTSNPMLINNIQSKIRALTAQSNPNTESETKLHALEDILRQIKSKTEQLMETSRKYEAADVMNMIEMLKRSPIAGPQLAEANVEIKGCDVNTTESKKVIHVHSLAPWLVCDRPTSKSTSDLEG